MTTQSIKVTTLLLIIEIICDKMLHTDSHKTPFLFVFHTDVRVVTRLIRTDRHNSQLALVAIVTDRFNRWKITTTFIQPNHQRDNHMPVAVDGRRRLPPEERKRLLLDYAVEAFAARGIGRGGHTEIAEMGGVSVATVFNYFNTREDLVDAVLAEVDSYLIGLAEEVYAQGDEPLVAIANHIKAFLQVCEDKPAYVKVWLEWSCSIREDIWPQYLEFQNKLLALISKQIDKAIKNGDLAPGLPAAERARWLLGNSQMLVSMVFDPSGKPRGMQQMVERGIAHILGKV